MTRSGTGISFCLVLALLPAWTAVHAHPDLDLQIEQLTRQISGQPRQVELYLKRGDLFRRHRDWPGAARDFETVRELEPDNALIDWYEGRFKTEAGYWAEGDRLLSRFLGTQPAHTGAYQARAAARWGLGNAPAAAEDYARVISGSEHPGPGLYRSLVITQIASGEEFLDDAAVSVDAGLYKFPVEVSLLGLGADLALAGGNTRRVATYLAKLPPGLSGLPQWAFRQAMLSCLEGDAESAAEQLQALAGETDRPGARRAGTWQMPLESIERLAAEPGRESCREAVADMLGSLQP